MPVSGDFVGHLLRHGRDRARTPVRPALERGVHARIDVLVSRPQPLRRPERIVRTLEPAAVHEVRGVHVGLDPRNEAVHVQHVVFAAVRAQPGRALQREHLLLDEIRRPEAADLHRHPAHARVGQQLGRDVRRDQRDLVVLGQRRARDFVIDAALPVVMSHDVRDDRDSQWSPPRKRAAASRRCAFASAPRKESKNGCEHQQAARADQRVREHEHREGRQAQAQARADELVLAQLERRAQRAAEQHHDAREVQQRAGPAEHERHVHHAAVEAAVLAEPPLSLDSFVDAPVAPILRRRRR